MQCRDTDEIPYMYTQFCDNYRSWARKNKATMRIHHKPGHAMEVDWASATLPITDPVTGEISDAYLFVSVLPCSCYVYAELCTDMKSENWLLCHVHAYNYFNGVPRLETILPRSYSEMANYYNTALVPICVRVKLPETPYRTRHNQGYAYSQAESDSG